MMSKLSSKLKFKLVENIVMQNSLSDFFKTKIQKTTNEPPDPGVLNNDHTDDQAPDFFP